MYKKKKIKIVTNFKKNNSKLRCYFCQGNHLCRNCPIEEKIAPVLKKKVGDYMESYIAENISCPSCSKYKLKVLGNNSPSLDIICKNCHRKIEVKSKCLSVKHLPEDLSLPHGNFQNYNSRQNEGLDFIIIIYSVNRIKKEIKIREILYIQNNVIINKKVLDVVQRPNSPLSTIKIKNKNNPDIKKIKIKRKNSIISFKEQIINLVNDHPINQTYLKKTLL